MLKSIFRGEGIIEIKDSKFYSSEIEFDVGLNNTVRANLEKLKENGFSYEDVTERQDFFKSQLRVSKGNRKYAVYLSKYGECSIIPNKRCGYNINHEEIKEIISILSGKEVHIVIG